MEPKDRIIVALDVPSIEDAAPIIEELAGEVGAFKIGLRLITADGVPRLMTPLDALEVSIFVDGKLKDIANTVGDAAEITATSRAWMFNIHLCGVSANMIDTAVAMANSFATEEHHATVLGVTILTDVGYEDLAEQRLVPIVRGKDRAADMERTENKDKLVRHLAWFGQKHGLDGVIASAQEAAVIRKACGEDFLIVTPGIRPKWAAADDQKRITTPKQAVENGADMLVIGRPIVQAERYGMSRLEAVKQICEEIASAV